MKAPPPVLRPEDVWTACARVADPEFGVDVVDLGLIYDVVVDGGRVTLAMTLTTAFCPAGDVIVDGVRAAVGTVVGVTDVEVRLVWDPPWSPEMISARGRAQLGWHERK